MNSKTGYWQNPQLEQQLEPAGWAAGCTECVASQVALKGLSAGLCWAAQAATRACWVGEQVALSERYVLFCKEKAAGLSGVHEEAGCC